MAPEIEARKHREQTALTEGTHIALPGKGSLEKVRDIGAAAMSAVLQLKELRFMFPTDEDARLYSNITREAAKAARRRRFYTARMINCYRGGFDCARIMEQIAKLADCITVLTVRRRGR